MEENRYTLGVSVSEVTANSKEKGVEAENTTPSTVVALQFYYIS